MLLWVAGWGRVCSDSAGLLHMWLGANDFHHHVDACSFIRLFSCKSSATHKHCGVQTDIGVVFWVTCFLQRTNGVGNSSNGTGSL